MNFFQKFAEEFKQNFIDEDRWMYLVKGLGTTLQITVLALILGLILGFTVAIIRSTHDKVCTKKGGHFFLRLGNGICKVYLTIIRGTPTMVQLLIINYIIFASANIPAWIVGSIAFGINSGAYIAEIVRGGILSVNIGQTEAGRSLGMTPKQTMISIVMPQAMKNILPALGNEFVVLIKETAVVGMVSNIDLVGAARKVQSLTYDYLVPLLSIAVIYYVVIKIISTFLSKLEKGMRKADKR